MNVSLLQVRLLVLVVHVLKTEEQRPKLVNHVGCRSVLSLIQAQFSAFENGVITYIRLKK